MDGSTTLHQDGPNSSNIPNAQQFVPNGGGMMHPSYNGLPPPPNYFNGPMNPMNPMSNMPFQHRPDMPSTSNGPLPPMQFQPHGFPSPMDGPNGNFYPGNPMHPSGMMPQYNGVQGIPLPDYFNGPMHPCMNGLPSTPSATPNGLPPEYPQMPPRVPSSSSQARSSPFGPNPMHNMPNGNGSMTPTYAMPGQAKTPTSGLFIPGGRTTPNAGFIFTTDMANQAATEVGQSKHQNIAQWHNQNNGISMQAAINSTTTKKVGGARNSPSYATAATSRKRKGSQAQDRQNPTPSPQLSHQPGSVPEFKQPMSNHAPGSVPDNSIMQFGLDSQKQIKNEPMMQIKNEPNSLPTPTTEHNPLRQLELMAKQTENSSSMTPKLNDQQLNSTGKQPDDQAKAEKLARLAQIKRKIGMEDNQHPPQYPPQFRLMPNGAMMPPNGPFPMPPNGIPNQPPNPMYYNPQQPIYTPNGPMPPNSMDMNGQGMPNGTQPQPFPGGIPPPSYMSQGQQRFPMIPQPNGVMPNNMRMPYPPMDMNMPRPEMFNQWQENMPQPLTNLDSRVPSQKINYYGNGNSQPQAMPPMPPSSNTPTLKNGG